MRFSLLLLFLFFANSSGEAQSGAELEKEFQRDKENQMMRSHLRGRVHEALDRRLERVENLQSEEEIRAYQKSLRRFFLESVGLDAFVAGPLNLEVTGSLERKGYTVEKVLYESLPGFHVTGNLYIPEGEGPFPGILHPCGHTANGKAGGVYQQVNILLAQHGFVVLCYDPIGQGERRQLIDPKTGKSFKGATGEHHTLGVAPVLLGRGLSSYMIWDGIRGIDCLQSRPEVDPNRIGCTGNSGGGNMTSFLMALDDRIEAAAPGCFMTTTRMKNESPGPGDPEQNLFAQTREGLDHPDFAILRAPKPTLILSATHDFVPIEGAWDAFRQAKRIYTKLGYPERIELIEAPEKHGFSRRLREGAVRFFARWLQGRTIEVFEPTEVSVEKDEDLYVTGKGQVLGLEGEKSLFEVNREYADVLAKKRAAEWKALSASEKRALVREVTGISDQTPKLKWADHGSEKVGSYPSSPGILLPTHRSRSEGDAKDSAVHLVCLDSKWSQAGIEGEESGAVPNDLPPGSEVILLNLRDSGFSKTQNWRFYGADAWIAYMLGDSYLAMRTEDLLAVAKSLREENAARPLHLHVESEFVPVAIHAAALDPELFASITLHGGITSWETVIDSRDPLPHLHNVVHGALKHYDLADLLEMIPEQKVARQ